MKIFTILLFFTLNCFLQLSAQNYQTLKYGRIAYFSDLNNNVKCIRIDSAKYQTDSVFYLFRNIQELNYNCYTPNGASRIGEKVIARNDGYNLFFNKKNDTVKIKTNALLNESWTAYKISDTIIVAKVINADTISFCGQTDSVKEIGFQAYSSTMLPINLNVNSETIKLSKNFGFVKTLNFLLFPDYASDYPFPDEIQEYNLCGLSNPKIGTQNLTWFKVFDFQAGDEIHVHFQEDEWSDWNDWSSLTKNTIYKYLGRIDYPDSVVYRAELTQSTHYAAYTANSFQYKHDTIHSTIKTDSLFDKLPGEPVVQDNISYSFTMSGGSIKTKPSDYDLLFYNGDNCWFNPCSDGCFPAYDYYKGLGGPYYSCENAFSFGRTDNELVYYKKGSETWGNPLIISRVSEIKENVEFEIYPNPSAGNFVIKPNFSNSEINISIKNCLGNLIYEKNCSAVGNIPFNLNNTPKGIYFVTVKSKNNSATKKICIQ
jgi:hypothetical protein